MLEHNIHSISKDQFEEQLIEGNIPKDAIAFIQETKEIWNNGDYYGGRNAEERLTAIEGFFDEGAKLNLTIKSNQGTDSTISAVKATIEYDGQSVQTGSGVIGLPVFTDIKITFPDVEGYKTPAPLEFTTGALPVVYEVTYETELVNVTVAAWDGTSVVGQIITINGTEYTWDGTTIQHKVPFGATYNVAASELDGYIRPDESFTASIPNRIISLQYGAMVGSWITLNQTITDPATMISGDINGEHIQLIRNNSHRYLGKYTADGAMTVCQLDDTDSNLYADGSAATLTGAEGDVFMKLPKFYYYATEKQTDVWAIGFYYGESAPSPAWEEWSGNDLIGVFLSGNEPRSVASVNIASYTYKSIKDKIESRGNGFSLFRWEHNSIIIFLTYALYGRTDITDVVGGEGATNFYVGDTISLGMEDTTPENASKNNTWGIESFVEYISGMLQYIDGAFYRLEDEKMFFDIERANGETQRYQIGRNSNTDLTGWISKIYIGKHLDVLYKSLGASGTSGFCSSFNSYNFIGTSVRPACRNYTFCGLVNSDYSTTTDSTSLYYDKHAARIAFKGTINIQNNSTAFKALTAIG